MLRVCYTELSEETRFDEDRIPLSAYRREKLRHVASPLMRRQMVAAEVLLNYSVRDLGMDTAFPLEIRTGEKGKPYFADLPLHFSLAHSGPFVGCAIADFEIGLDLQKRTAPHEALMKRCFSESERCYIRKSLDPDAAFTEIWCLKESFLKATGEGLTRSLAGISLEMREPLMLKKAEYVRFWRFTDPGFCLAVCSLNGKTPEPDMMMKTELRP